MKNIKLYHEHLRESQDAPGINIDYKEYHEDITGSTLVSRTDWRPEEVQSLYSIISRAKGFISKKSPLGEGIWSLNEDFPGRTIALATEVKDPQEDDLMVVFDVFPGVNPRDVMNVFLSGSPSLYQDGIRWFSKGTIPFTVNHLGRVLTELSGKPLDHVVPNAQALVSIIEDVLLRANKHLGISPESIKRRKRSRSAFGRF